MKNGFKYALLFIIPILLIGTIVIGNAYWKDSLKNEDKIASKIEYSVTLVDSKHSTDENLNTNYHGLEFDSEFELPPIGDNDFLGWQSSLGGDLKPAGCYKYSILANNNLSTLLITFTATYSN